jgi:hypothetical protein
MSPLTSCHSRTAWDVQSGPKGLLPYGQGRSQGVTRVPVVMGPGAQGGAPEGFPGGTRKGPRKKAARERAVKAKVGAVCFLEKGRK